MTDFYEALMQPGEDDSDWTKRAACKGDKRFIQPKRLLSAKADMQEMRAMCRSCPVFFECLEYHDPPDEDWHAQGVFAAGEYFDEEEPDG